MPGRIVASCLLIACLVAPFPVAADHGDPVHASCGTGSGDVVFSERYLAGISGERVVACVANQADVAAFPVLIVMAHGFGHSIQGSWLPHMQEIAAAYDDVVVLAPNYDDNYGFPIMGGADDLVGFTRILQEEWGPRETILYSVSMGSAIGGTALAWAPELDAGSTGMFDHWINIEGANNPTETYFEARALAPGVTFAKTAQDGMERDAGGSFEEVPEAYAERNPVLHVPAMIDNGLQSAILIHGLNDGLVPYDQSREMVTAMVAAGLPVEMTTVLRHDPSHTSGTTPTSHAGQPDLDPNEQFLGFAGHGSEADRGHIVVSLGIERLHALLNGAGVDRAHSERVYDEATGLVTVM